MQNICFWHRDFYYIAKYWSTFDWECIRTASLSSLKSRIIKTMSRWIYIMRAGMCACMRVSWWMYVRDFQNWTRLWQQNDLSNRVEIWCISKAVYQSLNIIVFAKIDINMRILMVFFIIKPELKINYAVEISYTYAPKCWNFLKYEHTFFKCFSTFLNFLRNFEQ